MREEREFPAIPDWLRADCATIARARLRRFGSELADLEFAFEDESNPLLIARLLSQCTRTSNGAALAAATMLNLPVGLQLEALLALAEMSSDQPFTWLFCCEAAQCQRESEFHLTSEELSLLADRWRARETMEADLAGHRLILRRPTGRDQLDWLERSDHESAGTMLDKILVSPSLDELAGAGIAIERIEAVVDEAMDEFDPLPGFQMEVVCPECGARSTVAPGLTAAALQRLVATQEALLDEVHQIASRYHWNEAEILRLPAWRRQGYLERIDAAESLA